MCRLLHIICVVILILINLLLRGVLIWNKLRSVYVEVLLWGHIIYCNLRLIYLLLILLVLLLLLILLMYLFLLCLLIFRLDSWLLTSLRMLCTVGISLVYIILEWYISCSPWKWCLFNTPHKISIISQISQKWHIIVWRKIYKSSLRENLKPLLERLSSVFIWMIVWAVNLVALITVFTRI